MRDTFSATILVRWSTGYCEINRDYTLNASGAWIRKFLKKVVALDWEHERQILEDWIEYLDFNTARLTSEVKAFPAEAEIEKKHIANEYADAREEYVRIKALFDTGKNPNGTRVNVRPTEGEVRRAKEKPPQIMKKFKAVDKRGKDLERSLKRCKENAEVIRKRLEAIK